MVPRHYRTVVRRQDVGGYFKWLTIEREELAQQYSRTIEEITALFEQCNCEKQKLK